MSFYFSFFSTASSSLNIFIHPLRSIIPPWRQQKARVLPPRKGKEIASDDLATKTTGEDAPPFESEHSNEEEGGRDPNNECASLINPWYDTHAHWLSISCRNTKVSWVPSASSIPDLVIRQGTSLPMTILFKFGSGTSLDWKEWVDEELSDTSFMVALQWASMLKAIVSLRCLSNYGDLFNLCHLVCQWRTCERQQKCLLKKREIFRVLFRTPLFLDKWCEVATFFLYKK